MIVLTLRRRSPVKLADSAELITIKSRQNNNSLCAVQTQTLSLVKYSPRSSQTFLSFSGYQLVTFTLKHFFEHVASHFYIPWQGQIITLQFVSFQLSSFGCQYIFCLQYKCHCTYQMITTHYWALWSLLTRMLSAPRSTLHWSDSRAAPSLLRSIAGTRGPLPASLQDSFPGPSPYGNWHQRRKLNGPLDFLKIFYRH